MLGDRPSRSPAKRVTAALYVRTFRASVSLLVDFPMICAAGNFSFQFLPRFSFYFSSQWSYHSCVSSPISTQATFSYLSISDLLLPWCVVSCSSNRNFTGVTRVCHTSPYITIVIIIVPYIIQSYLHSLSQFSKLSMSFINIII